MLVGEETGNNEVDSDLNPTLIRSLLEAQEFQDKGKNQPVSYRLADSEISSALANQLDLLEENGLEYMSGYFFKRLLSFHGQECLKCSGNAEKVTTQTESHLVSDIFLYFKKYNNEKSSLFKCNLETLNFVRQIIQIADLVFKRCPAQEQIISLVVNSSMETCVLPQFCTEEMTRKFAHLVAKTMLLNQAKWSNDLMKKKEPKKKKSLPTKKVEKLSHQ